MSCPLALKLASGLASGALLAAGVNTIGTATAPPAQSNDGGRIVFSRPLSGGGSQQFTVNPDGSDERWSRFRT